MITIAVYGSWFYAFGVLLDPIVDDTGWSETAVAAAFSSSSVIAGFGAFLGGFLVDRWGSRLVFALAAVIGGGSLLLAAGASTAFGFILYGALGGGVLASLGFYHITQTVAVRLSPQSEDRAIAVLTIWGAFSSAIYIPLAAWLVSELDWRVALGLLTISAVVALLAGVVWTDIRTEGVHRPSRIVPEFAVSLRRGNARRFMFSQALAGIAVGTILVYQVPTMTASGLALGAASFWAGFRGFAQLGGRLPLMALVRRFGVANTLRLAYLTVGIGCFALALAGNQVLASLYAVLAGFGIGALSPLVGMHSKNVFGMARLGTAMGAVSLVFLLANSVGPVVAARVVESTGSRSIPVAVSALFVVLAAGVVRPSD